MITVANVSCNAYDYKYMIVRDCRFVEHNCGQSYWYYGADNDLERAEAIAREIGNGFVVESDNVVSA